MKRPAAPYGAPGASVQRQRTTSIFDQNEKNEPEKKEAGVIYFGRRSRQTQQPTK
jgi:hypothetical protein